MLDKIVRCNKSIISLELIIQETFKRGVHIIIEMIELMDINLNQPIKIIKIMAYTGIWGRAAK